jgi:GAF domain-containing protein
VLIRAFRAVGVRFLPTAGLSAMALSGRHFCAHRGESILSPAANEAQRLSAVDRSGLVDTAPEESFDRLTWLAGHSLEMPSALLTMITPTRQWFKSRYGLEVPDTPRSWAFCNYTILQRDLFAVENLALDARFADNPAVAGGPEFRFYAGVPVIDSDGFALGSLCVIDHKPRKLDQDQMQSLIALAALASDEVRLRATDRQLRWALDALNRNLRRVGRRRVMQRLCRARQRG